MNAAGQMEAARTRAATQAQAAGSRALRDTGLVVAYLVTLAFVARALGMMDAGARPPFVAVGVLYLAIITGVLVRPPLRPWLTHGVLVAQSLVVTLLYELHPGFDFVTALFVPLAFEAALLLSGRAVVYWVAALAALTAGLVMVDQGPLKGLALTLVSVAAVVVFAAFALVAREIEAARRQSQTTLEELQATHARLRQHADQAGELAAVEARERVAREVSASVATAVSGIVTSARSTRAALAGAGGATGPGAGPARPEDLAAALAALQAGTQQALGQMRRLIAELRPAGEERR